MSSNGPDWWNQALQKNVVGMADDSYPNEFVGLFLRDFTESGEDLVKFLALDTVRSSPDAFFVPPQSVIDTAYDLQESGAQLLGTVHSHPRAGGMSFSDKDQALGWWGCWHLLCVWNSHMRQWNFVWARSGTRRCDGEFNMML